MSQPGQAAATSDKPAWVKSLPRESKKCDVCGSFFSGPALQIRCSRPCREIARKHPEATEAELRDLWHARRRELGDASGPSDGRLVCIRGKVPGFDGRGPIIAATDASIRQGYTGLGYLVSDGRWGLVTRYEDEDIPQGLGYTDFAELRAIAELILPKSCANPVPDLLLVDNQPIVHKLALWRRDGVLMKGWPAPIPRVAQRLYGWHDMRVEWAKGHAGHLLNEAADSLASMASRREPEEDLRQRAPDFVRAFLISWHQHARS